MDELCGWQVDEEAVMGVMQTFPNPLFQAPSPDQTKDIHNHLLFRKYTGNWQTQGWQKIGDCVSWGHAGVCDYAQVLDQLYSPENTPLDFQPTATEVIYGGSRVEIGKRQIRGDGSVGAWAARWACDFGNVSREHLAKLGYSAAYDPNRAREWGSNGIPDNIESVGHKFEEATLVTGALDAAWHIQNGRVVAVCSNVGFQNSSRGTVRDNQGFVQPNGRWNHCMKFTSVKWGSRPALLLENQWQPELTSGPMGDVEIPPSSWWVDMEVADAMLKQRDSWVLSTFKGYPARVLTWATA